MPFLPHEHALLHPWTCPSPFVSVSVWYCVSCVLAPCSCRSLFVRAFACIRVKYFHKPKRLVGNFISHRFSQMNRSLSTNRGNPQTPASRRQISQNVIAIYYRTLYPSLAETFCVIGWLNVSVHLCEVCSSVLFCERKNASGSLGILSLTAFRMQVARWMFYLSQIFTDEQKPFC